MGNGPSPLRVRLLGAFSVEGVADRAFGSRKVRLVLKTLALGRGQPVGQDRLIDVVWGADPPSHPADQLGVLVSRLRQVVGTERVLRRESGYVALIDWFDVDELETRVQEATSAWHEGRWGAARTAAESAIALAKGPLLPDDEGAWLEADRAACAAQVGRAHLLVAESSIAAGDMVGAAAAAEMALRHDPYDEAALRLLMDAHRRSGRPASGLAAYVRVRERLAEDLGVSPSPETEALHDELVLGGPVDATSAPAGGGVPRSSGFLVGREESIAALDEAFAETLTGQTVTVVVDGEAGIGKTTLVDTWARSLTGRATVLWGSCDEMGRDLPLQPLADALAKHLRARGSSDIEAILGSHADDLHDLLDAAGTGWRATVSVDPEQGRNRLFVALLRVIERLGDAPVVVVVEDLHDAGQSTLAWLSFAQRRGHRLMLLTTRRSHGPDLPGARRVELGPLLREQAMAIAGGTIADEVFERSGGNPLLLVALLEAPGGELPGSVREAATAQAATLGPAALTLRTAAVLGQEVDLDLLAEVLARPAVSVLADLDAAARVGLLIDHRNGYAFRHAVIREALEATTGSARRSLAHRDAARALRRREPVDLLAVAVHSRSGGDVDAAIDAFVDAAAISLRRFDLDEAAGHLDAAIALRPTAKALSLRARVRMVGLDLAAAADDAAAAIALDGGAVALEIAAWVAYYRRRYEEARRFADRGAERSAGEPALRTSCLAVAGRVRHGTGDLVGAVERLQIDLGAPADVQGVADVWLAHARVHQGRPTDALRALERAMVEPDRLAHPWAGMHGRLADIMALGQLGRITDALSVADDLDRAVERAGAVGMRFPGIAANARSWLLRAVGAWELADDANERALFATRGTDGGPSAESMAEPYWVALLDQADGCLLTRDEAGAARLLAMLAPLDMWTGTMAWHQRHRLNLLRARLVLADGDRTVAAKLARDVAEDAAGRGAGRYELLARAVEAVANTAIPVEQVAAVVGGLARCAAPEGWRLVATLADAYRVDEWRAEAATRAAVIVANAGAYSGQATRMVAAVLDR